MSGYVVYFLLFIQVKSVLDPCEDENEDVQDDEVSLGGDSVQMADDSNSDSEVSWWFTWVFSFRFLFGI